MNKTKLALFTAALLVPILFSFAIIGQKRQNLTSKAEEESCPVKIYLETEADRAALAPGAKLEIKLVAETQTPVNLETAAITLNYDPAVLETDPQENIITTFEKDPRLDPNRSTIIPLPAENKIHVSAGCALGGNGECSTPLTVGGKILLATIPFRVKSAPAGAATALSVDFADCQNPGNLSGIFARNGAELTNVVGKTGNISLTVKPPVLTATVPAPSASPTPFPTLTPAPTPTPKPSPTLLPSPKPTKTPAPTRVIPPTRRPYPTLKPTRVPTPTLKPVPQWICKIFPWLRICK